MKVIIQDIESKEEESIIINVKEMTEKIMSAINLLKSPDDLIAHLDNQIYRLPTVKVFYFESVDLKTFVYMEDTVYQSKLKLYELEELLNESDFLRVSKQVIVNLRKIKSIAPASGGRFQALLQNDEKVIISRQYVSILKKKFGL